MGILGIHHVAIICSDYARSRAFYVELLKFKVIAETFREERSSHKLDLMLPDGSLIELFSFPNPPPRTNRPEACGLRHLALAVTDLDPIISHLRDHGINVEAIRIDPLTDRRFTFFADPDGLPIELYEVPSS